MGVSIVNAQQETTATQQLEEVVVSDSRFELKRENSGKTVIKITAKELEGSQGMTVAHLINTKSGIEINGSRSVAGQNLGYFVRGGNNRQVLVVLDGVQMSDASQIANDFDLRLLDLSTIESIEITKGAASTLYGNAAATAVINITTKKAADTPIALTIGSTIGTNNTQEERDLALANFTNTVVLSGSLEKFDYAVSFANQYANGLSAFDALNAEKDPFSRVKTRVKLGYQFSNSFTLDVMGQLSKFNTDFDGFDPVTFAFSDTRIDRSVSDQKQIAISPKFAYKNGSLNLNASYNAIEREFFGGFESVFESEVVTADIFNKYVFDDKFHTILGYNYQKSESVLAELVSFTNNDPYLNLVYVAPFGLNLNVGTRLNNHSAYGSKFIYNFNPSYTFNIKGGYAKLLGSYSTSFIAPSLFQLFDMFSGNPELNPEENKTLEVGFEFAKGKNIRFSVLYFNREEENTVLFDNTTFTYANASTSATIRGAEVELSSSLTDAINIGLNYTFTEFVEGVRPRVPKHKVNGAFGYRLTEKTTMNLNYQFVGDRSSFSGNTLEAFSLVDFRVGHHCIAKDLKLFGTVKNVFNTDYVELEGYATLGRNYSLGLQLQLN